MAGAWARSALSLLPGVIGSGGGSRGGGSGLEDSFGAEPASRVPSGGNGRAGGQEGLSETFTGVVDLVL